MRRPALQVTLEVREPSVVELTVGERVQLDRLAPSPGGYLARRHGDLLGRGLTTVALDPGLYFFKTMTDANLRVVRGGVETTVTTNTKNNGPTVPPVSQPDPVPDAKGDEPSGEAPALTIADHP